MSKSSAEQKLLVPEKHREPYGKEGYKEVSCVTLAAALTHMNLGFLCPEESSKSLLSAYTLLRSGRIDLLVHFSLDPLRLSGHSVLVFFC